MTLASLDEGVQSALRSVDGNRLTLLLGAGLSIPSGLPSAQNIADKAKITYDGRKLPTDPPLSADIEDQAEFFFLRGELDTLYIQTLVDKDAFSGRPNDGHRAVADFLLTGAVQGAVSANYDTLIEMAGSHLYGAVEVALDGAQTTLVQKGSPLLKIHGCWTIDPLHTVWTPQQLNRPGIVQDRIRSSENWLATHLPNRDLLVVGFGAEWSYLNRVIGRSLGQITPARVIIVDMNDATKFRTNAPDLMGLGDRAHQQATLQGRPPAFLYVQCSSADFLERSGTPSLRASSARRSALVPGHTRRGREGMPRTRHGSNPRSGRETTSGTSVAISKGADPISLPVAEPPHPVKPSASR